MSNLLKNIINKIAKLSNSVDRYKKETVIQSLPSYTFVNRAKVLIETEKFEEAEKILLNALELPQKDALVYKYLGAVYEKLGKHEESVEAYQTSAELNPHDKNVWQRLGFELITVGKSENAEKSFENANRILPGNTNNFTGWGMALMKQDKYSGAHEKFLYAIKCDKHNFTALFLCAVMEVKLEMYDKAEMKFTFLSNVCPNANNIYELANIKSIKNDLDTAIYYAKKSIDSNPQMFPAYILLGQLYTKKFDFENAQQYFSKAHDLKYKNSQFYLEWGKSLQKFEKYEDAKAMLLQAVEIDCGNLEAISYLALCCACRKEFEEAGTLLEKVTEKELDNLTVKQVLGIIAYQNNDTQKAIELFGINDEDPLNSYYLAKCYERLDNNTKVKDYYEAAIRLNPLYVSAYTDYVKYLVSKEEFIEARRKLRKALKFNSENVVLLNLMFNVSYILVKEKVCEYNIRETISIAEKIEKINPDLFEYPEQKHELTELLPHYLERD